ncbi:hypothetical protein D9M68_920660 [compost metagenome]
MRHRDHVALAVQSIVQIDAVQFIFPACGVVVADGGEVARREVVAKVGLRLEDAGLLSRHPGEVVVVAEEIPLGGYFRGEVADQ